MYWYIILLMSTLAVQPIYVNAMEQEDTSQQTTAQERAEGKKEKLVITKRDFPRLFEQSATLKFMEEETTQFNYGYPMELNLGFDASNNDLKAFERLLAQVYSNVGTYQDYLHRAQQYLNSLGDQYLLFLQLYNYFDLRSEQTTNKAIYDTLIDLVSKKITAKSVDRLVKRSGKKSAQELTDADIARVLQLPQTYVNDIHAVFAQNITFTPHYTLDKKFSNNGSGVRSVVWSPDGTRLAAGFVEPKAIIWNIANGSKIRQFTPNSGPIFSVAWLNNGTQLSLGNTVIPTVSGFGLMIFNTNTGGLNNSINLVGAGSSMWPPNVLQWNPEHTQIAFCRQENNIKVFDVAKNTVIQTLYVDKIIDSRINAIDWSPNGDRVAVAFYDSTIEIFDVNSGQFLYQLGESTEAFGEKTSRIAWSPNGNYVAESNHSDTVRIWDLSTRQVLHTLRHTVLNKKGSLYQQEGIAWTPDSRFIATGEGDGLIELWDVQSGRHLQTLQGHARGVCSLAFSPNGEYLASGSFDQSVIVWKRQFGQLLAQLQQKERSSQQQPGL